MKGEERGTTEGEEGGGRRGKEGEQGGRKGIGQFCTALFVVWGTLKIRVGLKQHKRFIC